MDSLLNIFGADSFTTSSMMWTPETLTMGMMGYPEPIDYINKLNRQLNCENRKFPCCKCFMKLSYLE